MASLEHNLPRLLAALTVFLLSVRCLTLYMDLTGGNNTTLSFPGLLVLVLNGSGFAEQFGLTFALL